MSLCSVFYPLNSEGKRVTIRIQTITDTVMMQIALCGQRCGGGRGQHRHRVLRDYGPKGCLNGRPTDLSLRCTGNW